MNLTDWLPYTASANEYGKQAELLLEALVSGSEEARWAFKWEHPRFRDRHVTEVDRTSLGIADAQTVVARRYSFDSWADLVRFSESVRRNPEVARFEKAVEAVVSGDVPALETMLQRHPTLARTRSRRRHRATLLHYVAANGVEGGRQKTPPNAVEVAAKLLEAGADVDALADMYDARCTTMSMLVSSSHPAGAGLQAALAELLLDYGAALAGPGSKWQSALMTALAFGFLETARTLEQRGAPVDTLAAAAGLGRIEDATRLLPGADENDRRVALALAAQHGHSEVVASLLDAGIDPNRNNPDGFHTHSTPLHQAALNNHLGVVKVLIARGSNLDIRDTIYDGTPLDWAIYGERDEIASYLRAQIESPT